MSLEDLFVTIGRALVLPVVAIVFCVGPIFVMALLLFRRKKAYRLEADEPFTALPLRPPGESLRLKIEDLSTDLESHLMVIAIVGVIALCLTILSQPSQRVVVGIVSFATALTIYVVCGKEIFRLTRELWDYRLGFTGERVVGEELNQLLASGFRVFHDVPFNNFNIDHVLVGPPGVYAVETKARRKPADIKGLEKARIYSDGVRLRLPKYSDEDSIPQARLNASTLAKELSGAMGEQILVSAILTFPGWSIIREKPSDVNVLRPDEIKRSFPNRPKQPLSDVQIQRIAYHLTERCRLANEPKPQA